MYVYIYTPPVVGPSVVGRRGAPRRGAGRGPASWGGAGPPIVRRDKEVRIYNVAMHALFLQPHTLLHSFMPYSDECMDFAMKSFSLQEK